MDIEKYLDINLNNERNTEKIVDGIFDLKYTDGTSIFKDKNKIIFLLVEIVNIINNYYNEDIFDHLNSFENYKDFILNNKSLNEYNKLLLIEKSNMLNERKGVEGVINCSCGSTEAIIDIKQSRSNDEPATVIKTCTKCGTINK